MRIASKFFVLTLLLLLCTAPAAAQKKKKTTAEKDTIQVPFFHGVAVHVEMVGLLQTLWGDYGQLEAGLRLNLKDRYFPAFEIGYGKANETEDYVPEAWYKTKAPYFRIGCDFNLLRDKHDNYKLFLGVRYGFSKFSYDMTVKEEALTSFLSDSDDEMFDDDSGMGDVAGDDEEVSGTVYEYREYDGLKATYHWLELVLSADAKVWGPFHLGWDIRYRRRLSKSHAAEGGPWYIPGFGGQKRGGFTVMFNVALAI